MPFEKNNQLSQGRPKGSPNRITGELRACLGEFASQNIHRLQEWIDGIDNPADKLSVFTKILSYLLPKVVETAQLEEKDEGFDLAILTKDELKEMEGLVSRIQELKSLSMVRVREGTK